MYFVLWIDDEPGRFQLLQNDWTDVVFVFARGTKQINHYINKSGIKWNLILLDHDMGNSINGMEVCKQFLGDRMFTVACVSNNTPRRHDMVRYLTELAVPAYDIPVTDRNFSEKIRSLLE